VFERPTPGEHAQPPSCEINEFPPLRRESAVGPAPQRVRRGRLCPASTVLMSAANRQPTRRASSAH